MNESILLEALKKISKPIVYFQEEAEKQGAQLDGMAAIALAKDANWLSSVATEAIKKWQDSSGKETGMKWVKASDRLPENIFEVKWRLIIPDITAYHIDPKNGHKVDGLYIDFNIEPEKFIPFDKFEWLDESVPPYKDEETEEDIYDAVRQYRKDHPYKEEEKEPTAFPYLDTVPQWDNEVGEKADEYAHDFPRNYETAYRAFVAGARYKEEVDKEPRDVFGMTMKDKEKQVDEFIKNWRNRNDTAS